MPYKLDANHLPIKRALQDAGRPVFDSAHMGNGLSDLITTHVDGRVLFVEIKRPGPPSARRLTPAEEKFRRKFPEAHVIVQSIDEALRAVGLLPAKEAA
jgi:hypothetical protein